MNVEAFQWTNDRRRVRLHPGRKIRFRILRVRDPQSPSCIDVADVMSLLAQGANQGSDAIHGLAEGTDVNDLRSDVNAHASSYQMARLRTLAIELGRLAHGHSEFVFVQA